MWFRTASVFLLNRQLEGGTSERRKCLAWERLLFPEMLFARLKNVNTGFLCMHRNSVTSEDPGCAPGTQNKTVPRAWSACCTEPICSAPLGWEQCPLCGRQKLREAELPGSLLGSLPSQLPRGKAATESQAIWVPRLNVQLSHSFRDRGGYTTNHTAGPNVAATIAPRKVSSGLLVHSPEDSLLGPEGTKSLAAQGWRDLFVALF